MNKSTLVKWAVAALLAVPAMPLAANAATHKTHKALVSRVHSARKLSVIAKHRRLHHTTKRVTHLVAGKRSARTLSVSSKKISARTALSHHTTGTSQKATYTPPLIDGMHA
ncbi:MAG: hypothetical protein M3O30_09010 [Planctomycetota bacterium]|nr:hypothetical protein [Planctomycetota bacterium]